MVKLLGVVEPEKCHLDGTSSTGSIDAASTNAAMAANASGVGDLDDSTLSSSKLLTLAGSELTGSLNRGDGAATPPGGVRRMSLSYRAPQPRFKVNDLSDFTIDKLNTKNVGIHGRDEELEQLQSAFSRVKNGRRQLVLISGQSGSGKTRLAYSLRNKGGCCYVRGKFGLQEKHTPYAGIATACAEICGVLLGRQKEDSSSLESVQRELKEMPTSTLALLIQAIPILEEIVTLPPSKPSTSVALPAEEARNQIHFAFQKFLNIVVERFGPLVFVLDDLQWADASSLDLLRSLINSNNSASGGLVIIGIYRDNEVSQNPSLEGFLRATLVEGYRPIQKPDNDGQRDGEEQPDKKSTVYDLTILKIGDLRLEAVHQIVRDLLSNSVQEESRMLRLAQLCLQRTNGNPFFLLSFLKMLHSSKLIQFNFGTLTWTWDDKEVEQSARVTENVVELLGAKMKDLPPCQVHLLKLAACLGSSFERSTLQLVWRHLPLHEEKSNQSRKSEPIEEKSNHSISRQFEDDLSALDTEGFVLTTTTSFWEDNASSPDLSTGYSWAHDKVHEAALLLIPQAERAAFSGSVGNTLVSHMESDSKSFEDVLFVATNLLNESIISAREDASSAPNLELAQLNHRSSAKAIQLSAFENAAEYAAKGIRCLPTEDAWEKHYDLMLGLHTIRVRAEGQCLEAVLAQENRPVEDKFDVYKTWIDSLAHRGEIQKAVDLSFEILEKFQCKFPKRKAKATIAAQTVACLLRWKKMSSSCNVNNLPRMQDATRIELVDFMEHLCMHLFMSNDERLLLVIFRILKWTNKFGYCDYSAPSFAKAGIIINGVLGDIQAAAKCGQSALKLIEMSQSQASIPRTTYVVQTSLFTWTKPWADLVKPAFRDYDVCLQLGDTESAMWTIYHWIGIRFSAGIALEGIEADLQVYTKQMGDLNRDLTLKLSVLVRQMLLNLLGRDNTESPTNLIGKAQTKESRLVYQGYPFFDSSVCLYQGILDTYFGEYQRLADQVVALGPDYIMKVHLGQYLIMPDAFCRGISCYKAAQQTGRAKYRKLAKVIHGRVKKWADAGAPNVKHYLALLNAEQMVTAGKAPKAIPFYESAVTLAARGGYQQDAALASELCGEFYLNMMKDKEEATYRLKQAMSYWRSREAFAKADHIERKHSGLLQTETPCTIIHAQQDRSSMDFS